NVNILKNRATGVKGDVRAYGNVSTIDVKKENRVFIPKFNDLIKLHIEIVAENPEITRILYSVSEQNTNGKYIIGIRAVTTRDFMTASITELPQETLIRLGKDIMDENPNILGVYYDITQKPPATIEFE
ncbi:MAG: GMP synthase (glutamine-hydrolyzing), partial [Candidatus Odinarchaeia archaeon]